MSSAIHNFFIEQGSSFEIVFEYLDENGSPIPIDPNDCVRLKLKTNNNEYAVWRNGVLVDGTGLLTAQNDSSLSSNQIKWKLSSIITKTYNFDTASYALDIIVGGSPETNTIKLATGQIALIKDIFLTECLTNEALKTCKDCTDVTASDSSITPDPNLTPTPSSALTTTPTPTPSVGSSMQIQENLCDYLCRGLDIFAQLYTGSGINISDAMVSNGSGIVQNSYNTIMVSNTGIATNIELYIDSLTHQNPSDLTLFLTPPTGTPILLSHRNKINNYNFVSGASFSFSNKALPGTYLYNKSNSNDLHVNILNNSGVSLPSPYNSAYAYGFDHLFNSSVSGNWTLNVLDNDPGATGYIKGWNLVITYLPPETYIENT